MDRVCRPRAWRPAAVMVSLVAGTVAPARAQVFESIPLWPGATYSAAHTISADGRSVAGEMGTSGAARAFVWSRADGLTDLGLLPGAATSSAVCISGDGAVVVGNSGGRAFRWTAATGMQDLGTLPGGTTSAAYGVSGDGAIVVGWSATPSGSRAFRWTASTGMVNLGALPNATFSAAMGISYDGLTIVGCSDPDGIGPHAIRWITGQPMQNLGPMPVTGGYTQAFGVSHDGSWVVGQGTVMGGTRTFRWSNPTGLINLGALPTADNAGARSVSADGRVLVGYSDSFNSLRATIWTPETILIDLRRYLMDFGAPLSTWTLLSANDVSADGKTIVGVGVCPSGQRAWIARLPILPCLANCDNSTSSPILTAMDFQCFVNRFASGDSLANCDGSTSAPMLTVNDFTCFMNRFAAGCP
ncbi:MAG: hypothetical protein KF678_05225 [Phycisphaeraceae bacterium]|nr:hypothetical protein [Phycisphaeraceae bacterium]